MASALYVVIPTCKRSELLTRTLVSLAECELPDIYRETIVVENGPRMGAEKIVRQAAPALRVRYMHVEMANKSNALNEALRGLPIDALIVFFDDDVRFVPDVLIRYAEAATGRNGGEYYGGPVDVDYEKPPAKRVVPYLPESAKGWKYDPSVARKPLLHFLGANWATFVGDLRRLGGFDTRVGPGGTSGSGGQEWDMHLRMFAEGIEPVYVPEALVWHYVPENRCTLSWALGRDFRAGVFRGRECRRQGITTYVKSLILNVGSFVFYLCGFVLFPFAPSRAQAALVRRFWFTLGRLKGLLQSQPAIQ